MTLFQALAVSAVSCSVAYLAIMASMAVAAALKHGGRRDDPIDNHDALSVSRFTAPVSIVVPLETGAQPPSATLDALLALNYPEFEVIVVTGGLTDAALASVKSDWALEAKEYFYRQSLPTSPVRHIYRSARDSRLMVIDKGVGGHADAINCGANLARFRYITTVAPELTFDPDALLRTMATVSRDPANVIAVTSHVERLGPAAGPDGHPRPTRGGDGVAERFGAHFGRLQSVRSVMTSRIAWRHLRGGLAPSDGVIVWRRDAIIQAGGFSHASIDAELDMLVRLQASVAEGSADRVVRSAEVFGWLNHESVTATVARTARRQLAALQTMWKYIRRGRTAGLGAPTLAYVVASEVLTPLAQLLVVVTTTAGAMAGWFPWWDVLLAVLMLSFGNAIVANAALLVRGSAPGAPEGRELMRLLLFAPLEFIAFAPLLAYTRTVGAIRHMKLQT